MPSSKSIPAAGAGTGWRPPIHRWPSVVFSGQPGRTAQLQVEGVGSPSGGPHSTGPIWLPRAARVLLCVQSKCESGHLSDRAWRGRPDCAGVHIVHVPGAHHALRICGLCMSASQKMQVVHPPRRHYACGGTCVRGHGPHTVHIVHFWPFMHPGARTAWNWKTYRERSNSGRAPMR